jgi:hypothetical protein
VAGQALPPRLQAGKTPAGRPDDWGRRRPAHRQQWDADPHPDEGQERRREIRPAAVQPASRRQAWPEPAVPQRWTAAARRPERRRRAASAERNARAAAVAAAGRQIHAAAAAGRRPVAAVAARNRSPKTRPPVDQQLPILQAEAAEHRSRRMRNRAERRTPHRSSPIGGARPRHADRLDSAADRTNRPAAYC